MGEPMIRSARYAAGGLLGRGGQGAVLRVVDREAPSRKLVAKIPFGSALGEPAELAALAGEFALLSRLRVPGLVRAHDFAQDDDGVPFFVEDFVEGVTAEEWLGVPERERSERVARLAADLAETLAALHDAGFIHGDVKPAHVRVAEMGATPGSGRSRAVLLDLGAAVLAGARRGAFMFTPAYAAPEVVAGAPPHAASDLFSLGATLWALVAGAPPPPLPGPVATAAKRRRPLRETARWLLPSLADVIESLLAEHPADRPIDARHLLAMLGQARARAGLAEHATTTAGWEGGTRGVHARERELGVVLSAGAPLRYVVGPSGAGKSHLVREAVTRALLAGVACRLVTFPTAEPELVLRLVSFLRGDRDAWPFEATDPRAPTLLVIDDLDAGPPELCAALEAYRCRRASHSSSLSVVATTRTEPPAEADRVTLAPLDAAAFRDLCGDLGITDPQAMTHLHRESGAMPGWLVASVGRVPLTRAAALARVEELPVRSRELLAMVSLLGGAVPDRVLHRAGSSVGDLLGAGLLTRDRGMTRLSSPQLASDLAAALSTFALADRAATLALEDGALAAQALLTVAGAPTPPSRRLDLLREATARARRAGHRSVEIDALLALVASPEERTSARLSRLERLTRDAGSARAHPQVLVWLDEAAARDASLLALRGRRRAEQAAFEGRLEDAAAFALGALDAARASRDMQEEAFALATIGAVALYRADWVRAEEAFATARARLLTHVAAEPLRWDQEEAARLDHNLGVVALYRGRAEEAADAFERALVSKRALGDLGGVRTCLLNLGLSWSRTERHDDAERALVEATALAESLGQPGGRAWCLAARADLAVRRGRAAAAERLVAEASALGDALPGTVRADLVVLRAQIALLEGDGNRARVELASLSPDFRATNTLSDARATALEGQSWLVSLPADRSRAARLAIAAVRKARAAGLAEVEAEALGVLGAARRRSAHVAGGPRNLPESETDSRGKEVSAATMWNDTALLTKVAEDAPADQCAMELAKLVLAHTGAERVFVASLDDLGAPDAVWGVDVDGLPISDAARRVDAGLFDAARACVAGGAVYQPDVSTIAGGRGTRLAVGSARAVVVAEHRFRVRAFDHVVEADASRWVILAGVVARLARHLRAGGPAQSHAARSPDPESEARVHDQSPPRVGPQTVGMRAPVGAAAPLTTVLPHRESRRVYPAIVGESAALRRALAQLDAAVDTDLPVLIRGETGTGKELFAHALHEHGARTRAPFVAVNCAAIADSLFEAELFGHARGAFTGADRARPGLVARAEGGTLFLDEVGELPLPRQATLLRTLETKRYRAVGSDDERPFDVRIVTATNRDLDEAVRDGRFRQDLLYRLRVLELVVPPLRDRHGDIEALACHFLAEAGSRATFTRAALRALSQHAFPGNVRELLHLVQRLSSSRLDRIDAPHLPREMRAAPSAARNKNEKSPRDDRGQVEEALARTGGNISQAATLLGLTRHGLKKRMLRLGLRQVGSVGGSNEGSSA